MLKRWRLLKVSVALAVVGVTLSTAYAAVPFFTAWSIREAVRDNDSAYLEHKIEWAGVRSTLKDSLASYTLTPPGDPESLSAHPGIWQRVKEYFGRGAVDRFVDATMTPTGINGLFTMRKAYKSSTESVGLAGDDPEASRFARMRGMWKRVTRAEFASLTRFELDTLDKDDPARTIAAVLELRGFEWKLTELRIHATPKSSRFAATHLLTM